MYAAGILPYTFFNGQVYLLLGKDVRDNFWSDFGGKSEPQDEDKPMVTAIREFYEETCGIIMDPKSLRIKMNNIQSVTFSNTQNNKVYYMYAIEIPYNSIYRGVFRRMIMYLKHIKMYRRAIEKTDIKKHNPGYMEKFRFTHQSTETGSEVEIVQEPRGSFRVMNGNGSSNSNAPPAGVGKRPVAAVNRAAVNRAPAVIYKEQEDASEVSSGGLSVDADTGGAASDEDVAAPPAAVSPATPSRRVDDSFKDFINLTKRRPKTPTPKAPTPVPAAATPKANSSPRGRLQVIAPPRQLARAESSAEDDMSDGDDDGDDDDGDGDGDDDDDDDDDDDGDGGDDVATSDAASEMSLRDHVVRNQDDTPALKQVRRKGNTLTDIKKSGSHGGNGMSATQKVPQPVSAAGHAAQMQEQQQLGVSSLGSQDDPNRPSAGFASLEDERVDLLFKLDRLRSRNNFKIRQLNDQSCIDDIRKEYNRVKTELELEHSISFSRRVLMAVVSTLEFLNKKYDPFDLALNGWSESVMENINSYDNVLERLYYKYRARVAMPPELELLITLAGSAFMFHMTNALFKSMASSMGAGGAGSGKNPDLMQSIMAAFANIASKGAAPAPPTSPPADAGASVPQHHAQAHPRSQAQQSGFPATMSSAHQRDDPAPQHDAFTRQQQQQQQPQAQAQAQYRMKGPDVDLNSVLGGAAGNMLPSLVGLMGGMGGPPADTPVYVPLNPISSSSVVLPRRAIDGDERFANRSGPAPSAAAPATVNARALAPAVMLNNRAAERPFFPDPPAAPAADRQLTAPRTSSNNNGHSISGMHRPAVAEVVSNLLSTPALMDDERLSDINTADLESIRTDALDSVATDDERDSPAGVRTVAASSSRKEARMARLSGAKNSGSSASKGKSSSGGTRRSTKQGGRIMVF